MNSLSGFRRRLARWTAAAKRCPPRLFALVAFHNEIRYLPGFFRNVAPQVDGIVALDDGSTDGSGEFVAGRPSVVELLRKPPRAPHDWSELDNRTRLIAAAVRHRPDWLIAVDADERLERGFRRRAEAEIARAEAAGILALSVHFRELWDAPDRFRADGKIGYAYLTDETGLRLEPLAAGREYEPLGIGDGA